MTFLTGGLLSSAPPRKRNVFFSFHYADIMRVNNVRLSQEFKGNALTGGGRDIQGFYDYSLWERRKTEGAEAVKRLIRDGVDRTSAVCVLIGTETWARRWVRYEIALSVVDGRGLLAVHINSLAHHLPPRAASPLGANPCDYVGICKKNDGKAYLVEFNGTTWQWYADHTAAVPVPRYLSAANANSVVQLSIGSVSYDWKHGGHTDIGHWIDNAAQRAGR